MNAILSPALGIRAVAARRPSKHAKLIDLGDGRHMTVRHIAATAGIDITTALKRIKDGDRGDHLLRPARQAIYDVGNGQRMTLPEIMAHTGLSAGAIRKRISDGETGEALLRVGRRRPMKPRSPTMVLAFKLARAFPDRVPSVAEVMEAHPMSESAALEWIAVIRHALEKLS